MDTFFRFLYEFLSQFFNGLKLIVMGFVKDRESACTGSCDERTVKRSGFLGRLWKSLGMCLVYETPKAKMISEYIVKDTDSKKNRTDLHPKEKRNTRKNKTEINFFISVFKHPFQT